MGAQIQRMRSQIEQLQAELLFYRGDAGGPFEELQVRHYFYKASKVDPLCASYRFLMSFTPQILKHKISILEASNAELQRELQERRVTCESLTQRACDAQVFL